MLHNSQLSWLEARNRDLDVPGLARALNAALKSPLSFKIAEDAIKGDWEAVMTARCDPRAYQNAEAYFRDAIAASAFKKVQDFKTSHDRKAATFKKWLASEHACFRTNQRLYAFRRGCVHHTDADKAVARHIDGVRKIIESWIGKGPSSKVELGFSPGSTLSDRGYSATVAHKISNRPSSTPEYDAFGYRHFIGTMWHHHMVDAGLTPSLVRGGEYFTVPKTALVDRPAELQPSLNISVQLGYGRQLRSLLRANTGWSLTPGLPVAFKSLGWDLKKAQTIHREVACGASVSRAFATIDLSSASDTIAIRLVEALLPSRWFRQLDSCRTHHVSVPEREITDGSCEKESDGKGRKAYYRLEKFSSMGNGFTFELESILFAAMACYVTRQAGFWGELGFDVFVYGDDIIVRDELYSDLKSMLEFFGLSVNDGKSFHGEHPFRESCGGDYFLGSNVRPFSIEKVFDCGSNEIRSVINQIKHCSERLASISNASLNRAWFHALKHLPHRQTQVRGPAWLGDIVIFDPNRDCWVTRQSRDGNETQILGFHEDVTDALVPWYRFDEPTQLAVVVLGFGTSKMVSKGVRRLFVLPRRPKSVPRTTWYTLECNPHGPRK